MTVTSPLNAERESGVIETRGIAKLDQRDYLESCPMVFDVTEANGMLHFKYSAIPSDIPDGVFFDLTQAPF